MEYTKREDSYEEYGKYSSAALKMQQIPESSQVQGYHPSEKETQEKTVPIETMRMKNGDGMLSVGINRKFEASIAITSDSPVPLLRGDREAVNLESAKRVRNRSDQIYTNSHDQKVSAVLYKENLKKSPTEMLHAMKRVVEMQENEVIWAATPFLKRNQDMEEKKEKEDELRKCLEKRENSGYRILREEQDQLQAKIARKEKEESRLIHNLTALSEAMKEKAQRLERDYQEENNYYSEELPEVGDTEEEDDDGEEGNEEGDEEGNEEGDEKDGEVRN